MIERSIKLIISIVLGNMMIMTSCQKPFRIPVPPNIVDSSGGKVTTMAGSGDIGSANDSATAASFNKPFSVAVDAAGNVYVGDAGNELVRKISRIGGRVGIVMSRKKTITEFMSEAKDIHGEKYVYSSVAYLGNKIPVTIICPAHGDFQQSPIMHLKGQGCPDCGIIKAH